MTEFQKTMTERAESSDMRADVYPRLAKCAFSQEEREALLQIADGFRKLSEVQKVMATEDDQEADA